MRPESLVTNCILDGEAYAVVLRRISFYNILHYMTIQLAWPKVLKLNSLLKTRKKKVATSVTLAGEVLEGVDLIVSAQQRSQFVEGALRRELRRRLRRARADHDLQVLNAKAAKLDTEIDDLLEIQGDPFE